MSHYLKLERYRFESTLIALQDCNEHLRDKLSSSEHDAREKLIQLCSDIDSEF